MRIFHEIKMFCNQPFSHFPSQKIFPPTLEYFNAIRTQTQFDYNINQYDANIRTIIPIMISENLWNGCIHFYKHSVADSNGQ